MTRSSTVSVVIPNRDRITELGRALKALQFQTFRDFELIVVSNQPDAVARFDAAKRAHVVDCQNRNISAVRNLGLCNAAGQIVAFLDDDAVPEPKWLERLIAPFDDPEIAAVGGLVRGRNGVSYQWGPQEVDCFGNDWPLDMGDRIIAQPSRADRVLKTVGTNCAFRAQSLRDIGGFDPCYVFYLDETDVNWRLSQKGWKSAIVTDAEVHHGYAASFYRNSQRVPKSLLEIGASKAYFCKRFGDPSEVPEELDGFRRGQRNRLIRAMELGLLAPGSVSALIDSLEEGFVTGAGRTPIHKPIGTAARKHSAYLDASEPKEPVLITTRLGRRKADYGRVFEMVEQNFPVTVFDFSVTARMLTVRFTEEGYWLHKGGIFGRGARSEQLLTARGFLHRTQKEMIRIAPQRRFEIT